MLHLFGLVLLVLCTETVFMEAMLTPCPSPPKITFYSSFVAFLLITVKTACLGPFYSFGARGFLGVERVLKYAFREGLLVFPFSLSFIFPGHGTKPQQEKCLCFHCTVSPSHKLVIQEMLVLFLMFSQNDFCLH